MTTPTILPTPSTHTSVTGICTQTFSSPPTSNATPSITNHQSPSQIDGKNTKASPTSRNNTAHSGTRQLQSPKNEGEANTGVASVAKVESSGLIHTTTVTYTSSSTLTTNTKITNSMPIISQAGCLHQKDKVSSVFCKSEEEQSMKIKYESSVSIENFKTSPATLPDNKEIVTPETWGNTKEVIKPETWCKDMGSISGNSENEESSPDQFSMNGNSNGSEGALSNKPLTPGPPGVSTETGGVTQSPLEMVQSIVSSIPVPSSLSPVRPGLQQPTPIPTIPTQPQSQLPQQQTTVPMSVSPGMYSVPMSTNVTVYGGANSNNMVRGPGPVLVGGPPGQSGVFVTSGSGCNGPTNMVVVSSPFNTKGGTAGVNVTSGVAGVVGVQAAMPQVQVQQHMQPLQQHIQPQLQPQIQPQLQPQLQQFQPVQPVVQLVNTFATMQAPVIIQNGGNIIQSSTGILHSPGGMLAGPPSLTQGTIVTGQQLVPTQATLAVEGTHHQQQQSQVGQPQSSPHLQVAQVVTTGLTGEAVEDARTSNASTPLAAGSTPSTPHSTPGSTPGSDTPSSGGSSGGRRRKRRRNTSTPQGTASSQSSPQQQQQQQQGIVPTIIMGNKVQQHMVMNGPHMTQVAPYGTMGTVTAAGQMAQVATGAGQVGGGQMLQAATAQGTGAINVVQMVGNTLPNLPVQVHNPPAILVGSAPPQGVVINQLADGTFISTDPSTGMSYPVQLQLSGGHIVGMTPTGNAAGGMVGPLPHGAATGGMPAMVAVRPPVTHTTAVVNGPKVVNISPSASAHLAGTGVHVMPVTAATAYPAPGTNVSPGQAVCVNQGAVPPVVVTSEYTGGQPVVMGAGGCSSNTTVVQHKTTIVQQRTTLVATQGGGETGTHSSVSTQTPGSLGESDVSSSDCVGVVAPASPSHQSAEVTTTRHDEDATPPSDLPPPLPPHSPDKTKRAIPEEPHSASTSGWW